ncbi:MAG TPA: RDD family protein [Gemmatimonadales bacterium]|nr:RDD family protein [Gemmatimonadales bacterium]
MENRIGFGKRFLAALIDGILCGILAGVFGGAIGAVLGASAGAPATAGSAPMTSNEASTMIAGLMTGALLGFLAIAIAYSVVEGFTGWTLGKLILGIQIGNQDGTPASTDKLLLRWAIKNCNAILTVLAAVTGIAVFKMVGSLAGLAVFIGFFFIFAAGKQGFHDMIAKTAVYPRKQLQGS